MNLVIYHNNCADGYGAAWVMREYFKQKNEPAQFFGGTYQEPPPAITKDTHVWLVDFSYKRAIIEQLCAAALKVTIIDHHKTAIEDLKDYSPPKGYLAKVFDLNRSGAGLTWDTMFPGKPRPKLIDHIEDRDLWKFKIDGTRYVQAALFSYPYHFPVWDDLMRHPLDELIKDGMAIERKHNKDIDELIEAGWRMGMVGGYHVPVLNVPYLMSSDAGHKLAKRHHFAACYWDNKGSRVFSLRSEPDGVDVSTIAALYGGGGHRSAAGFSIPFANLMQYVDSLRVW